MKIFIGVFLWLGFLGIAAQANEINIIPQPQSMQRLKGEFELDFKTKIVATDEAGRRAAGILNDLLLKHYGFKLEFTARPQPKNAILFTPQGYALGNPPPESYGLNVTPKGILVIGNETGQFYALQTLMQLLPVEFKGKAVLPAVDITDAPRFSYRGMHLDAGRHFFSLDFIKRYLDLMAQYKFNRFHWHLTDDQGWRIEIKKYPKLTEIGSRRPETMKEKNFQPYVGDGVPVEGFYTQAQIREIVAYARARQIAVIPEIELPGHSSAALAAYPQFGCKENYRYQVQTTWGIFKEVFCPTEATFKFLEDVLAEVIELFPDSPYIHIGGDEVLKDHWKESAFVQELKRRENLRDEHEVQSYFIRRIEKFVNARGKRIIGWDEILEGGLAPNAAVMSWRGERGGIAAAKAGHEVVMTPTDYLYFDYAQGDPEYEPINIGNFLTLEKVYSYNPQPAELSEEEKRFILGAQGNLWTEYLKKPEHVEYMVFPRLLALAEVVWSPPESKNFADFQRRLAAHLPRLDRQNVNYRIPAPEGLKNVILADAEKASFELRAFSPTAKIYYSTDGSLPTEKSARYVRPFEISLKPNETAEIKTIVVNEKGRRSAVYAATVTRRAPLKATEPGEKKEGVSLKFYQNLPAGFLPDGLAPNETIVTKSIRLQQFADKTNKLKDAFAAAFDGFIYAPETAVYEFQVESDGQTLLRIGGETILSMNDDGAKQIKKAIVPLEKGFHKIDLRYRHADGEAVFNCFWGIKGQGLRRIRGDELFH